MVCGEEDYARKVWIEGVPYTSGTPIVRGAARTSAGSTNIYTVPVGKVFYLIGVGLTALTTRTVDYSIFAVRAVVSGVSVNLIRLYLPKCVNTDTPFHHTVTQPFPIPIKMVAGESISTEQVVSDGKCYGNIVGYELTA